MRALLRRFAPPVLKAARRLGLGPLPGVPRAGLQAPAGGEIAGWAAPGRNGRPLRVGLFRNGRLLGEALADRPRPDVAALGLGPERSGFMMSGPDLSTGGDAPLILCRMAARPVPLATWPRGAPARAPDWPADPAARLRLLLAPALAELRQIPAPAPIGRRAALFAETDGIAAYTRHALLAAGHAVPDDPEAARAAYLAIEPAGAASAPLSAADLARLPAPDRTPATPGPWPLSRAALAALADRPALGLDPTRAEDRRLAVLSLLILGEGDTLPPETATDARAALPDFVAGLDAGPPPAQLAPRTAEGHRLPAPALRPPSGARVEVQVVGPLSRASGLGQAARATAAALATTGLSLRLVDDVHGHPTPGGAGEGLPLARLGPARITILHQNLEAIPRTLAHGPDPGGSLIGYGFWELDRPPPEHALGLALIDRLWTASPYGAEIYRGRTDTPIEVAGLPALLPVRPDRTTGRAALARAMGEDLQGLTIFLASFDSYSFIARKNPGAVLAAFQAAFPGRRDVRLVLKTHNRTAIGDPAQRGPWADLLARVRADRRIRLIDATLPFAETLALTAGADAYVSLHRAEGWGFGLLEAMALGVPVIATGHSGNLAFMGPDTSRLVAHRLVPVPPGAYLRVPDGARWAEPDPADAARAMAEVADDTAAARARAARAEARIAAELSPQAVGRRLARLLAPLLDSGA